MQVALSRVHVNKEILFLNGRAFSPLSLSFLLFAFPRRRSGGSVAELGAAQASPELSVAGSRWCTSGKRHAGAQWICEGGGAVSFPPPPPSLSPPPHRRVLLGNGPGAERWPKWGGGSPSLPPRRRASSVALMSRGPRGLWGGWRRTTPEAGTAAEDPEAGGDDLEVGAAADAPKDPATSSSPSNAAASSWWWPRRWPELSLSPLTPVAASPLSPSTPASASPLSHPASAQIGETGHEARGHSRTAMPFSPVHLLTKNA